MANYVKNDRDYGYKISVDNFNEACSSNAFIDYDGHGYPMKDELVDFNMMVKPSSRKKDIPKDATHILWMNR